MKKSDIIGILAENQGMTKADAKRAVELIFDTMARGIRKDGEVQIKDFGTFKVKATAARTGRNPSTGEAIQIPAGKKVKFIASKFLL